MKAQPLRLVFNVYEKCEPRDATHLFLQFPGPLPDRMIPVMIGGTRAGTSNWTWNGDCEKPTIKPSVLTCGRNAGGEIVCHSWVNDGMVHFLTDCSHELAGKSVPLLEVDFAVTDDERGDNAAPTAANPDLLDALTRILHFATGGCDMDAKTRLKCIARECEASIAKATGTVPVPVPT